MSRPMSDPEERFPSAFEPHTVLPVQFFTRLQRGAAWSGEQRLMAAVLEDAVNVCCRTDPPKTSKQRQLLRETLRWLRSNDRTWMFSFLRVCESLDLDAGAIRRGVRARRGEELPSDVRPLPAVAEVVDQPRRSALG